MRKTAWIWAAGCVVWVVDASLRARRHDSHGAVIGAVLAMLFFVAWVFFRQQRR